jgi:uncharacterized protein
VSAKENGPSDARVASSRMMHLEAGRSHGWDGHCANRAPVPLAVTVPPAARWLFLLAHGAGAGMRHPFMEGLADALARRDVATVRYDYPYMAARSRRPDPAPCLEAVTRAVAAWAAQEHAGLRLAAGGKSMGGRMTSQAHAASPLPRVERLIFVGFPLHPARKPATARADHLQGLATPMLFLQGTRDALADLSLIRGVCRGLGPVASLHEVDGADHGCAVLRRSGRTAATVMAELADTIRDWLRQELATPGPPRS